MIRVNKTKVIASTGPSIEDKKVMLDLVKSGVDCFRINFSHCDYSQARKVKKNIDEINKELATNISLMVDTKGPELRTLDFVEDTLVKKGDYIYIVKDNILGDNKAFSLNYPKVLKNLKKNDLILIDDGLIKLKVVEEGQVKVKCQVLCGGIMHNKKGVFIPGVRLDLPFLTDNDKEDLKFASTLKPDFVALSFVTDASEIRSYKRFAKNNNLENVSIIAKIETALSIRNYVNIIDEVDGIMVARGDLGVEVNMAFIPIFQKKLIDIARSKGKIAIVATEMLASMEYNSRPTRAELSDVANSVFDGADSVMLSAETSVGAYPVDTVNFMVNICDIAEKNLPDSKYSNKTLDLTTSELSNSSVLLASKLKAPFIIVITKDGYLAKLVSNLRPKSIIVAVVDSDKVAKSISLNYAVNPVTMKFKNESYLVNSVISNLKTKHLVKRGDHIIVTGNLKDNTLNYIRIITI